MATHPVAHITREPGKYVVPTWRRYLGRALPMLITLAALLSMPGLAFASGTPVSLAVDPASGPVGTQVTVKGANFTPGDSIQIGYAVGDCSTGITIISGATGTAGSDGTITITFIWPSTNTGDYVVCAKDTTDNHTYSSSNHFHVASATAPAITVSSPVKASQPVTVTGANFLVPGGGTVEILYGPAGSDGCATSAGTTTLKSDGSFTFTFNAPYEANDTQITITGVYPQGACDGTWVLRASKTVTVLAAAASVTPSPKASPSTSPALSVTPTKTTTSPVGVVFPPSFPPTPAETVVYCLIGLLLLLLLLLLFLLLARRKKNDDHVVIRQSDRAVVNAGPGGQGTPMVQSSIYAENPRNQRRTQIAEEVTSIQEEPFNPPNPPGGGGGGQYGQQGRFGPAGGSQ